MMLKRLLSYIHCQKNHFKESFRDPFFYICLVAIYDSERFFRELPGFVSSKDLFQTLWFSGELFNLIKVPLCYLSLCALATGSLLFFLTRKLKLTYLLLFSGYFIASFIHFHFFHLYHRSHLLMYALFIMIIYSRKDERPKAIDLLQGLTLMIYGLTGFWKLFFILKESIELQSFSFLQDVFPRHIAHFFLHDFEYRESGQMLIDHPEVSTVLFLAVMIFQVSSAAIYQKRKLYPIWAAGILAFHFSTYYFLNILFWQMILLVIILFLFPAHRFESKLNDFSRDHA